MLVEYSLHLTPSQNVILALFREGRIFFMGGEDEMGREGRISVIHFLDLMVQNSGEERLSFT